MNSSIPSCNRDHNGVIKMEVERAIAGDTAAFAMLMKRYQEKIYQLLRFIVHNHEDAMDLLQDTFLKAYTSLDSLRSPGSFYSWLTKIAVNLAFNSIRRRERVKKHQQNMFLEFSLKMENPSDNLQSKEIQEKVKQLIAMLPDKQRKALVLYDIEGYSYKEISEMLQCRIGTVMSRIYYARDRLRQNLREVYC